MRYFHKYSVYPEVNISEVNNANANDTFGPIQELQIKHVYVMFPDSDWTHTFDVVIAVSRELQKIENAQDHTEVKCRM